MVGTCITRYYLEKLDRTKHREHVIQLIGPGPPNNGSGPVELFQDPEHGATITNRLNGVFVPEGFDPAADTIVQDVRPKSGVMHELRTAGIRKDVLYQVIVTANPDGIPGFFLLLCRQDLGDGGGREVQADARRRRDCAAWRIRSPGTSLDIIPPGLDASGTYPHPDHFCHINIPKNPAVIDRIMRYLTAVRQ